MHLEVELQVPPVTVQSLQAAPQQTSVLATHAPPER